MLKPGWQERIMSQKEDEEQPPGVLKPGWQDRLLGKKTEGPLHEPPKQGAGDFRAAEAESSLYEAPKIQPAKRQPTKLDQVGAFISNTFEAANKTLGFKPVAPNIGLENYKGDNKILQEAGGKLSAYNKRNIEKQKEDFASLPSEAKVASNIGGAIIGLAAPGGTAYNTLGKGAVRLGERLLPKAGKYTMAAIRGVPANAGIGGYEAYTRGEDAKGIAKGMLIGGFGGAILDPAFVKAGQMVSPALERLFPKPIQGPQVTAGPRPISRIKYGYDAQGLPAKDLAPKPLGPELPPRTAEVTPLGTKPLEGQIESVVGQNRARLPKEEGERGFVNTLRSSEKVPEEVKGNLLDDMRSRYKKVSNEEVVKKANNRVSSNIDEAASYVMSARVATPEHIATGHRLIDEFNKAGNFERAVDVAEKIAELGTKSGQSIQAFSIYDRLSTEGILVHAQRIANKVNEKLPVGAEPVKITGDMASKLTDLASTVKTMSGTKQAANDVISILERAKAGQKLTDAETETVRNFVKEAKQFVDKVRPLPKTKPPREISDKRVRDNVLSFFERQEAEARARIQSRRSNVSSIPLDEYADYAIIGASKMAKGVVRFADWSEQMAKEFGENIRPHLEKIYEKAVDSFNVSTKKIREQTISNAERITERIIKNKGVGEAEANQLKELAQKVSGLSGDAKTLASQDLQAVLQTLERPSTGQKISSFQTIMQLFNPKTWGRNAVGNELFYRVERINKYIAAPIDWARVKLIGGERAVTFATNNQGEYWKNWLKGAKAGWKGVNPEGLTTQYDLNPKTFNSKWNPLTYMEKILGATLKSFDYAAYKRSVNETLGEMATLDAINRGLKGNAKKKHIERFIRNAGDNILAIADEYGRYVTFQDNNVISVGLSKFKRGLNLGKDFGLGDLILKYPRTPGALVMRALDYSPAGFLRAFYILAKPMMGRAEPNTREVMHALSRAIVGTVGLTGFAYFLADKGILTGSSSKDKDIRELQAMAGKKQYQVNVTALKRWFGSNFNPKEAKPREGDTLISYDWAQPVAIGLSMGANIDQNIDKSKSEMALGLAEGTYDTLEGGLNTLVEQSVLGGVKKAFETNSGESGVMDKLVSVLSEMPASFVPTLSNQARQLTDNTRRSTKGESKTEEALNKAKNKVPWWSNDLPVEYDTLGKPKEVYQDGSNNIFNVLLNPSFVSTYKPSQDAKLVIDLISKTGDEALAPRAPQRTIKIDGESYKLSPDEYSVLQQLVGQETVTGLRRIDPKLDDKHKAKAVERVLNKAGEKARNQLRKQLKQKRGQ